MSYGDSPHNFNTGITATEDLLNLPHTHWKVVWTDSRGIQKRLYNTMGTAKAQVSRLAALNIIAQLIPCTLIEHNPG